MARRARVFFWTALFPLGPLAALAAWFFAGPAWRGETFVFRDAGHYYRPLFEFTSARADGAVLPLWNSAENLGVPLAGDPTASLFYPGRLVFFLPGFHFDQRYQLYLVGHVLGAALGAYAAARCWNASRGGAALAALGYGFGAPVLSQTCNAVYLVGAAWLPLALLAAERVGTRRSFGWALALGGALAGMTLGGDPHAAYNAGLAAALLAAAALFRRGVPWKRRLADGARGAALLGLAAVVALALAAAQALPALRAAARGERAAHVEPRSLYEAAALARSEGDPAAARALAIRGLWGVPTGGHAAHIYEFSVGPWRWAEAFWPNLGGRQFPEHRRWLAALPAEGRSWTPSLYFGLAPALLGLLATRWRGGPARWRWLSALLVFAVLAALGGHGLGWLWHEFAWACFGWPPEVSGVGPQVGGLYWLLALVLPGYALLRYPAKWLPLAVLALCLLSAHGFDRLLAAGRGPRVARFFRRRALACFAAAAGLSLAGLLGAWLARPQWFEWLKRAPGDELFGPLDRAGAHVDLCLAFVHGLIAAGGLLGLAWAARRWPKPAGGAALALTAVELALANGWLTPTAPREIWRRPGRLAEVIQRDWRARRPADAPSPPRVHRGDPALWSVSEWGRGASPARQVEGLLWDRDTLLARHHLTAGVALVESPPAAADVDFAMFWRVAREAGFARPDGVAEPHPQALDLVGAAYVVLPAGATCPEADWRLVHPSPGSNEKNPAATNPAATKRSSADHPSAEGGLAEAPDPPNAAVWRNPHAFPRAWVAPRAVYLPPLGPRERLRPDAVAARARLALFPKDQPRDFTREAVVECDAATRRAFEAIVPATAGGDDQPAAGRAVVRVVAESPGRVALRATLPTPGVLVLADAFDDEWSVATRRAGDTAWRAVPMARANRVLRGAPLGAGDFEVLFTHRPASVWAGTAVSAAAALLILLYAVGRAAGARRRRA